MGTIQERVWQLYVAAFGSETPLDVDECWDHVHEFDNEVDALEAEKRKSMEAESK